MISFHERSKDYRDTYCKWKYLQEGIDKLIQNQIHLLEEKMTLLEMLGTEFSWCY